MVRTTLTTGMERVIEKIGTIRSDTNTEFADQLPNHHQICEGVGFTFRSIDYETSGKHYTQLDCETHQGYCKIIGQWCSGYSRGNMGSRCR